MSGCVFCGILRGEIEGSFVKRGELCSAFLDLHPMNPGHVLVVPNAHFERFSDLPTEYAGPMFEMAQKILRSLQQSSLRCEGANIFLSDGAVAGQEVPHVHLHVGPRFTGDGLHCGFLHDDPRASSRPELEQVAAELRARLETAGVA
jgi:histidine triad (HIT) family protein